MFGNFFQENFKYDFEVVQSCIQNFIELCFETCSAHSNMMYICEISVVYIAIFLMDLICCINKKLQTLIALVKVKLRFLAPSAGIAEVDKS